MSKSKTVTLPRDLVGAVIAIITDSETSAGQQFIKECWAVNILVEAMKQPDAGVLASGQDGWKLVPVEPTQGMLEAGKTAHYDAENRINSPEAWEKGGFASRAVRARHVFQAMLAAAPQPQTTLNMQPDPTPYLWYDPENGDTWTQEAIDEGFCATDSLIPLYTK